METLETEARETLELFSRYEIAEEKTLQYIGEMIEAKIRDRNTDTADAITYLLVARKLNVPNLENIATAFYYSHDKAYLIDLMIEVLLRNQTISIKTL